jgi:hypothetical protein
VDLA